MPLDDNEIVALRHRIEVLEAQLRDCNDRPGYEELRRHAYKVVKANGEQAFRIRDLEQAMDKLQDEIATITVRNALLVDENAELRSKIRQLEQGFLG